MRREGWQRRRRRNVGIKEADIDIDMYDVEVGRWICNFAGHGLLALGVLATGTRGDVFCIVKVSGPAWTEYRYS